MLYTALKPTVLLCLIFASCSVLAQKKHGSDKQDNYITSQWGQEMKKSNTTTSYSGITRVKDNYFLVATNGLSHSVRSMMHRSLICFSGNNLNEKYKTDLKLTAEGKNLEYYGLCPVAGKLYVLGYYNDSKTDKGAFYAIPVNVNTGAEQGSPKKMLEFEYSEGIYDRHGISLSYSPDSAKLLLANTSGGEKRVGGAKVKKQIAITVFDAEMNKVWSANPDNKDYDYGAFAVNNAGDAAALAFNNGNTGLSLVTWTSAGTVEKNSVVKFAYPKIQDYMIVADGDNFDCAIAYGKTRETTAKNFLVNKDKTWGAGILFIQFDNRAAQNKISDDQFDQEFFKTIGFSDKEIANGTNPWVCSLNNILPTANGGATILAGDSRHFEDDHANMNYFTAPSNLILVHVAGAHDDKDWHITTLSKRYAYFGGDKAGFYSFTNGGKLYLYFNGNLKNFPGHDEKPSLLEDYPGLLEVSANGEYRKILLGSNDKYTPCPQYIFSQGNNEFIVLGDNLHSTDMALGKIKITIP